MKNILSLFDGMSCCQIALNRAGIKYDKYFASEIDKYAIKVTQANFPDTVQLGSVTNVKASDMPEIYLMAGGSPCQSFSFAGKRKGMVTKCEQEILSLDQYLQMKEDGFEFEGQSYLFWEFVRLLQEVKPKYFLLENVMMEEKWERIITRTLGVHPIMINAALVSAQSRKRLWWTNIGLVQSGLFGDMVCGIQQPKDRAILLRDILESEVDEKDNLVMQLNTSKESNGQQPYQQNRVYDSNGISPALQAQLPNGSNMILNNSRIRRLTPTECERLQTVDDGYTAHVSDSQRYKMLGNGWCVDVPAHIFTYLPK